jgi:cytochrome c5
VSKTDDIFWRQFGIILGLLVLFGFVVAFIARSIAGDAFDKQVNSPSAVAERIAPVGAVRVGDPKAVVAAAPAPAAAAAPGAAGSAASAGQSEGQSVYSGVCQACHVAGVAGAPKLGDAEAWAPRIALGEDALVQSVLNGKGAMPPKGGNPALSEQQIRAAIEYMISQTTGAQSEPAGAAATAQAMAGEAAQKVKQAAGEAADKAGQMAGEATAKAKELAADATGKAKQMADAASGAVAGAAAGAGASAGQAQSAGKPGQEVYNSACVACHVTGVANAPKLGDKAAWEPRAATGFDALMQSVLNGKGAMPPKGGATTLEQADIENAVRYMLEQAGVSASN